MVNAAAIHEEAARQLILLARSSELAPGLVQRFKITGETIRHAQELLSYRQEPSPGLTKPTVAMLVKTETQDHIMLNGLV